MGSLDNHHSLCGRGHKPRLSHLTASHLSRLHMARPRLPIHKDKQDITDHLRRPQANRLIHQPTHSHRCLLLIRAKHHHSNNGTSHHLHRVMGSNRYSHINNRTSGGNRNNLNTASHPSSTDNSPNLTANMFVAPHVIL